MIKIAFVFRHSPHGSAFSREGLDVLLAATAFCAEEEIGVFFVDDGVLNLVAGQKPQLILQKDFIPMFKLLDLYDIEQRYACSASWQQWGLAARETVISVEKIDRTLFMQKLQQAEKILTF
ncbi:protein TusC [[Pasteurella] mairii]|uniref:Protein TusC n=1 Tax=[Pasteurella] mairii TaxID=757 RepID=A0A379B7M2_9PAST|nr:protein TusC [[Pasteurella] mairii]